MKVSLDAKGKMTITPENDLENYALNSWLRDWKEKKIVVLEIEELPDNASNGPKSTKQIKCRDFYHDKN